MFPSGGVSADEIIADECIAEKAYESDQTAQEDMFVLMEQQNDEGETGEIGRDN